MPWKMRCDTGWRCSAPAAMSENELLVPTDLRQVIIDLAAVGDCQHANDPPGSIDGIHDPESPDAKPPEALQLALQQRADRRVRAEPKTSSNDSPLVFLT